MSNDPPPTSRFGLLLLVDIACLLFCATILPIGGAWRSLPGFSGTLASICGLFLAPLCLGGVRWAYVARAGIGFVITAALVERVGEMSGLPLVILVFFAPFVAEQALVTCACIIAMFVRDERLS